MGAGCRRRPGTGRAKPGAGRWRAALAVPKGINARAHANTRGSPPARVKPAALVAELTM